MTTFFRIDQPPRDKILFQDHEDDGSTPESVSIMNKMYDSYLFHLTDESIKA